MSQLKHIAMSLLIIFSTSLVEKVHAQSFSNYSSHGGSAEREPNKKLSKGCNQYTCGPTSIIKLSSASPFTNIDKYNYNSGENSTFEQMIKMGEGSGNFDPTVMMKQMGATPQGVQNGKEIEIIIPLIDYGFTGSFSNILIKVSSRNEVYKSIEQGLTNKDQKFIFKGNVTIEKYSPYVLKGSYSAPLYWYEPINARDIKCPAFSDPSTPPCTITTLEGSGNVNGKFNILSPWRDDSRLNKDINSQASIVDPFKNDIKGMVTKFDIDADVDKEFAKGGLESSNSSSGSDSSRSPSTKDNYGGCNCSCNFVKTATTQCKTVCSSVFSACIGERYKPPQSMVINKSVADSLFPNLPPNQSFPKLKDAELQGIDQSFVDKLEKGVIEAPENLRNKYIAALQNKMPGPANASIREMMIKGFDEMPDNKAKMMMFKSVGGN